MCVTLPYAFNSINILLHRKSRAVLGTCLQAAVPELTEIFGQIHECVDNEMYANAVLFCEKAENCKQLLRVVSTVRLPRKHMEICCGRFQHTLGCNFTQPVFLGYTWENLQFPPVKC